MRRGGPLGLLGLRRNLPENVSVRAYMNFDMVALNYPIVPLTEPIIDPLTGDIFEPTKYDWSISIAGASRANMERMMDMVTATIEDDLAYTPPKGIQSTGRSEIVRLGPLFLLQRRLPDLQFLQPRRRHQLLARVAFPLQTRLNS